jgi:phosphatidylglycerol:prolipoprotein diacylglycerol transferase
MFPDLLTLQTPFGEQALHTYGLLLILGFFAATLVTGARMRQVGLNSDRLVPLMLIAIPSSISGSLYARRAGLNVWKMADVGAPSIMLGLAIGRLGCFAAGCCHGQACPAPIEGMITGDLFPGGQLVTVEGFPWVAMVFNKGVGVGSIIGHPVYPTQLWESLGAITLFGVLSLLWRYARRFDGQILAATMILYPPMRYTIETFRGDELRGTNLLGMFSTSQLTGLIVLTIALGLIAWRWPKGLAPETPLIESDLDPDLDPDLLKR